MSVAYKLFGVPVYHPVLKVLAIVIMVVLLLACLALAPILVPLHFILRKCGRNGFYSNRHITIGRSAFEREDLPHWSSVARGV